MGFLFLVFIFLSFQIQSTLSVHVDLFNGEKEEISQPGRLRSCFGFGCTRKEDLHQLNKVVEVSPPAKDYLTTKHTRSDYLPPLLPKRPELPSSDIKSWTSPNDEAYNTDVKNFDVYQIPYKPKDLNEGIILDLLLNNGTDGFVLTNLNKLVPEVFANPKEMPKNVDERAIMIQKKISELMEPYGVEVIAFLPIHREVGTKKGRTGSINRPKLHIDYVHPEGIDRSLPTDGVFSSPKYTQSAIPDYENIKHILEDREMIPVGVFNLWYTLKDSVDYPLAVANAHTADGKYGTKQFDVHATELHGPGLFMVKEFQEKLRLWSSKKFPRGTGLFFNSLLNPHMSVRNFPVFTGQRISDDIRFAFYAKKGVRPDGKEFWFDRQRNAATSDISQNFC